MQSLGFYWNTNYKVICYDSKLAFHNVLSKADLRSLKIRKPCWASFSKGALWTQWPLRLTLFTAEPGADLPVCSLQVLLPPTKANLSPTLQTEPAPPVTSHSIPTSTCGRPLAFHHRAAGLLCLSPSHPLFIHAAPSRYDSGFVVWRLTTIMLYMTEHRLLSSTRFQ